MALSKDEFKITREFYPDTECNGFKMRFRHHYYDGSAVREIFGDKDYYRLPKNPKLVIDVGGHIGLVSLLMARAGAEVYTFEPEALNYETLCHNIEINGYQDKVHCINKAVGKSGTFKLYIHPSSGGCNSFYLSNHPQLEASKYQMVPSLSIHEVFSEYKIPHCDFLKLDCEKSEEDIFNDMDDELASKIDQISTELHGDRKSVV
jgi:FkbM family methyltransferase